MSRSLWPWDHAAVRRGCSDSPNDDLYETRWPDRGAHRKGRPTRSPVVDEHRLLARPPLARSLREPCPAGEPEGRAAPPKRRGRLPGPPVTSRTSEAGAVKAISLSAAAFHLTPLEIASTVATVGVGGFVSKLYFAAALSRSSEPPPAGPALSVAEVRSVIHQLLRQLGRAYQRREAFLCEPCSHFKVRRPGLRL